jgi:hypothetical protein
MTHTRLPPALAGALFIAAVAAAVIVLNVLLLGRASTQNEPAGRLTPRVNLPQAPGWTVRPTTGRTEDRGADD